MGASQSTVSEAELQEQIARKIRALELRAHSLERQAEPDEDYVHVNKEKSGKLTLFVIRSRVLIRSGLKVIYLACHQMSRFPRSRRGRNSLCKIQRCVERI